jgi:hypothetical protein
MTVQLKLSVPGEGVLITDILFETLKLLKMFTSLNCLKNFKPLDTLKIEREIKKGIHDFPFCRDHGGISYEHLTQLYVQVVGV